MKRELPTEGATPGRDSSRRSKVRRGADTRIRDEDEVSAGELDLNATPRGFDLNAPVVEEEDSAELSVWQSEPFVSRGPPIALPSQPVPGDPTRPGDAALVCAVQVTESVDLTDEAEKNSACTVNDTAKGDVIEDASKAGSACPLKLAACIAIPVEISSSLGVDEDLDIIHAAWAAVQQGNMLALDNVLTDACEELAKNSQSLSKYHLLSCLYISKKIPEAFRLPGTYQKLRSLLSYGKGQPAQKRQNLLPVLACRLLQRAFSSEAEWPVDFVEHYLEDAIGARAWIENDGCKEFVLNVLSAFPDPVMDGPGVLEEPIRQDHQGPTEPGHGPASQCPVRNRYPGDEIREHVRKEFHNALNQLLATNATKENPRMLLRLLVQGAGYEEVRVMASSMLESWLNNPVHVRTAKSLLDRIVKHTHATSENDFNTVANLLALRVTSLQVPGQMKALHGSIFADMVSQLVRRRSEYATLALKTFVTAEINNKNPHNVKSIATVLKAMPDSPPPEQELASILQELAAHEDSRPHLRDLVRRIMKQAISDINVHALCHGLMQPWPAMEEQSDHVKESWLKQIVDLFCQLLLHAVAPYATDEGLVTAVNLLPTATGSGVYPSGSGYSLLKEKLSVMEKFSIETANLQEDAMAWCTDVLAVYLPQIQESDFLQIVQQLLFLKGPDIYAINSENPGDLDMLCYKLLTSCLRAPEEILARLILMGISNYPLTQAKAMDIIEGLVWRAAKLQNYMVGALTAKSDQLPAAIFKLSSANLSPNTRLQFVLKDLFWRAAIVVLTIAVCNPTTIGQFVWLNCPTIRVIMEAILTGRRKVAPPCGDGVDKFEADRLELEAIQRDVKAEEAISAFYAAQVASELVTPVPWPFQGEEWRGNVMVFNPGGPTRQPPITVLEDLRHIDDVYHLGSMLRKCRSPNFFSEITSSQTLRHAWPWLESVIVSDPDVMVVLPCLWQCELLYMHEASSTKSELQTLNLSDVKWNLQKILTEGSHLNDVDEVNIIISFFAMKLASRNSATRYYARCCLTRLLTGDCEAAVTDFARTAIPENGGSAGGTVDPDSCDWLEMLDGAATKFLVIEALVPSLQLAIQIESNIHVVASYLDFLQKHVACSPPSSTLACCVSFLVVYRKSLAASLLATVSDGPERTGQKKFNVANFMLQTVLTAIQLGTGHDQGWSRFQDVEAPVVGLVTTRASTVTRVEVHKMVVDAALQLLAWFANNVLDATKQAMYDELLELLLPGFTHFSKTFHDSRMVAWLETAGGQKFSLLSEAQATSFARTKDARVHSAALSFLSLEAKLDILAELGLSASAGTALLEEFDGLSETRLSMVLALKGVTLQRAKKICGSVISLQHSGSHGGSGFLRMLERHISAFVHCQSDVQFAPPTENDNTSMEHEVLRPLKAIHGRHLSEEELFTHVSGQFSSQTVTTDRSNILAHERKAKTHIGFNYMSFRKKLAICLILADFEDINKFLESMIESLAHARGRRVPAMTSIALSLPILSSLWHCGFEEHLDTATAPEGCKSRLRLPDITEFRALFLAVLSLLHSWLNKVPGAGNPTIRTRELYSLVRALFIIDGFKDCSRRHSVSWRTRHLHSNLRARLKSSGSQKLPPSLLVGGPIQNLEAELIALFCLTVSPAMVSGSVALGMGKDTDQDNSENVKESVITELGNLMKHWEGVFLSSPFQKTEEYDRLEQKQVELCGRLGLVVELLLFIDPELQCECHMSSLSSLHAPNHVTGHDLVRRELEAPSHARIALEGMFHQGSWITISRIVGAILSYQNETQGCLEQVPTAKGGNPGLTESEAYMEFLDCCSYHPHAQLECHTSSESNFMSAIGLNFITASLQPSSARALVRLAVVDCSLVNILMQNNVTNNRHVSDHRLHFYSRLNRGLRLIMFFASKELELIAAMLQELVNLQEGTAEEILAGLNLVPQRQDAMTKAVRVAANYLVWGLYSAFPISVTSICEFGSEKESANGHHAGSCPPEWVSRLDLVLHNSLNLIFSGDERESNAAFDFLHEFSRQHPLLVAPHLPMLALHLKNMLPLVKQVDNQARSTAARTLAFGIELLDSLRPSVLEEKKMDSYVRTGACCESVRSSKSDVDIILSLYFEFLQDLDVQDRPHFAKVVARVADFLCHCVAAGGRYRQLVMSHHKPLLQTAAHTFGKIKKLGYLLTLLDSASCTDSVEDPLFQEQDEKTTPLGARTGPALPVEDVLKVKKQILQFLRWQAPHEREGANHCGPGKELHYSPRDVHGFHMEEIEDVSIDAALSDLEQASARMPTLLPLLQDSLLELSKVSNVNIRDKAFSLLQRQLLHCPSKESATKIVRNLQEQLASSQVALAKSAARQVSSFYHCCPEFQEVLLVEMLKLGRPVADDLQQLIQRLFTIVCGM